jgi:drug/metabolite transporter (DMT)-like permease
MNKQVFSIVAINIMWSFIPVFANELFDTYSVLLIVFSRLITSGSVTLAVIFVILKWYSYKQVKVNEKITDPKDRLITLKISDIFKYLKDTNKKFYGVKQWVYVMINGFFTLAFQIVFYFFGFKLTGVIFSYAAFPLTIIIIAIYDWGLGKEEMDSFKGIYLGLLIIVVFIIMGESFQSLGAIDPFGLFAVTIFLISRTLDMVFNQRDSIADREYRLSRKSNKTYKLLRNFLKASITQLFGALAVLIIAIFMLLFPESTIMGLEARSFFIQFPQILQLILSVPGILLILICTIIPFSIWYTTGAYWPRGALSFDQWASILAIVSPLSGIWLGIFFLEETFDPFALIIIMVLMLVAIFLRYLHESTNMVNSTIMVKIAKPGMNPFIKSLMRKREVLEIYSLLGYWDLCIIVQTGNSRKYSLFLTWLRETDETVVVKDYVSVKNVE